MADLAMSLCAQRWLDTNICKVAALVFSDHDHASCAHHPSWIQVPQFHHGSTPPVANLTGYLDHQRFERQVLCRFASQHGVSKTLIGPAGDLTRALKQTRARASYLYSDLYFYSDH